MFKFSINDTVWIIEEIKELEEGLLGQTLYTTQEIKLLIKQANKTKTLKHELTHVWLWEYGHNQHRDNKKYTYEDICEIVASSNNFINRVVKDYEEYIENNKK